MARRQPNGWELQHNKRSLKGVTMKDIRRRRARRLERQLLRMAQKQTA